MGSLYVGEGNAPVDSGNLFTITVDKDCNVTVADNAARGGIVMENPQASSNDNLPVVVDVNILNCSGICYTGPDVLEWQGVGKPTQWCNPYQCHGDADGQVNTFGRGATARVSSEDVAILIDGFRATYGGNPGVHTWIGADFDHIANTYGRGATARVSSEDVSILIEFFRDNPSVPEPNCL
jgi:hypothetical protein